MAAPKGNQFWKARSKHGRDKIFETPEILWEACIEYFEWVEQNPLNEAIAYQGKVSEDALPKMRPMTIEGLCNFLGIVVQTWRDYRDNRKDFSTVCTQAEQIIMQQCFDGASAGFLNPSIIARKLGLADKQELTGKDGEPLAPKVAEQEIGRALAFALAKAAEQAKDKDNGVTDTSSE